MRITIFTFLLIFFAILPAQATTWDEPWHEQVIKASEAFVKARVIDNKGSVADAEIVRQLGGAAVPARFKITGYALLQLTSVSSHSDEGGLPFRKGEVYYLFLKKSAKDDSWQIATPTTGYAFLKDGLVQATYRHSLHKANVPEEIYEKTMTAIFQGGKGLAFDKSYVEGYVKEQLSQPVSVLGENSSEAELKRFFLQHAALESVYHLGVRIDAKMLAPFLESPLFHVQVSAARAAGRVEPAQAKEISMKFIEGNKFGFAKVMSVWALKRLDARELTARLEKFLRDGKDEETDFNTNIMDPRIGTRFPESVKASVKALLAEWKNPKTA